LVSDKHPSIASFAKTEHITHHSFLSKNHTLNEQFHVQYINNLASRLKYVINKHLHGVSTKYLQNYANWFKMNEKYKNEKDKITQLITQTEKSTSTWDLFTNVEKIYETFINCFSRRTYRCPTKRTWKSQNWNMANASEADWL